MARGSRDQRSGGVQVTGEQGSLLPKDVPSVNSGQGRGCNSACGRNAAFCDLERQVLLRALVPSPPFIYSFIQQVLSPVAEHKGSTSYNHILHLCRIFIPCEITSLVLFCLPRGFYSITEETGLFFCNSCICRQRFGILGKC